jgi:hypothetical protein
MSGNATPVMKTTKPSKNFPAAASDQMRHCMPVIGADFSLVPSPARQLVDIVLHRFCARDGGHRTLGDVHWRPIPCQSPWREPPPPDLDGQADGATAF